MKVYTKKKNMKERFR